MDYLVSVIVPVYNVEDYVSRCIESIVNQTYKNLEIILIDDGSSDLCPQICDKWADKDNRIKVIHKTNAGVGFARNSGLEIARGEYVMFVDSDDYLSLNAVTIMLQRIIQDQSDMVVAQRAKVHPDGRMDISVCASLQDEAIDQKEALHRLYSEKKPFRDSVYAKLYKKKVFEEVRFTNLKTAEDTRIAPDVIIQCNKISVMRDVVYYYLQRETSTVHTMTVEKQIDKIKAVLYVARFLFDRSLFKEASHYYHAAVGNYYNLHNNETAKQLIDSCFCVHERKILRKNADRKMIIALAAAKFPTVYKFYKNLIKRNNCI